VSAFWQCSHLEGYWINRDAGNFRCYACQSQFHIGDNLPANHPTEGIEVWEEDDDWAERREAFSNEGEEIELYDDGE